MSGKVGTYLRGTLVAAACVVACAYLLAVLRIGKIAVEALGFPLSLDYGEGVVVQQALNIATSVAYGDYTQPPFIIFMYPPVYLLVVKALSLIGIDAVLAGRLVSVISGFALAGMVAVLVQGALIDLPSATARRLAVLLAPLLVLTSHAIAVWMMLARIDMLAFALTFAGLALALRAPGSRWKASAAAMLFSLAVFTRQTTLAAPIAATCTLALTSPRDAWRLVGTGLAVSLAGLAAAMLLTGGGFYRHIIALNIQPLDAEQLTLILFTRLRNHAVLAGLVVVGVVLLIGTLRARRADRPERRSDLASRSILALLIFLLLATPLLLTAGKRGSDVNYAIEWIAGSAAVVAIGLGLVLNRVLASSQVRSAPALAGLALMLGSLGLHLASQPYPAPWPMRATTVTRADMQRLIDYVAAAPKPVLSDDMVLLLRARKPIPWEPFIFAELSRNGVWDQTGMLEMVRSGKFAFLITEGGPGPLFWQRYDETMAATLEQAFPRLSPFNWLTIRLPPGQDLPEPPQIPWRGN